MSHGSSHSHGDGSGGSSPTPTIPFNPTTYPAGSNDALVTQVTGNFMVQVQELCSAESAALLICDLENVIVDKCDATVSCSNSANTVTWSCQAAQAADAVAAAITKAHFSPDQAKSVQTLTSVYSNTPGYDPNDLGVLTRIYASQRCNARTFSQQSVVFPLIQLTDCTGDVVTAANSMDAVTRCSMGVLSELIPPDPAANSLPYPAPIWENGLVMSMVCGAAFIVICAGILGAVGIAHAPALSKKP